MLSFGSAQHLLSSCSLPRNVQIKICRTIIMPLVLHGCETCLLTLREGRRLRVFENRVLKEIFGPERNELRVEWKNSVMRSLMIRTPHQILFG